jgi:hypothetical protein
MESAKTERITATSVNSISFNRSIASTATDVCPLPATPKHFFLLSKARRPPSENIDLGFYGDINLTPDHEDVHEQVVPFTHDTLEGVLLLSEHSQAERTLMV